MQGRTPEQEEDAPAAQAEEVGNINAVRAYSLVDAIRIALEVGILGFGTTGTVARDTSLITAITAEGVSATFSLIIAIHEFVNVLLQLCCRRDGHTVASTNRAPTEYSLYLCFRLVCVAISYTGVGLIASDIAANTSTYKTTVGIGLITLGVFASRALTGSKHKQTNPVLYTDEQMMEMGVRRAQRKALRNGDAREQRPLIAPVPAAEEMQPARVVPMSRSAANRQHSMRPNAHFQQQTQPVAQASGFGNDWDVPLTTDAAERMKQQPRTTVSAAPPASSSTTVTREAPIGTVLWNPANQQAQEDPTNKQKQEDINMTSSLK